MDCLKQTLTDISLTRQSELIFANCDCNLQARPATLLSLAASIAGHDYDARGLPYEKLYALREVFLLSRIAMHIHHCPVVGDVLDVITWENGTKGAHMQRVFEMTNQDGTLCVSMKSDWVLVDPLTRKILRPNSFTSKKITVCPKEIDCPQPRKLMMPREGTDDLGSRRVCWSDLDGNGHIYSGNYGDIVWDYLPADLQPRTPRILYLNYSKEATLDETLHIAGARDGETYLMEGTGPNGASFTCACEFE